MDRFVVSRSHSGAYQPDRRHPLWLSIVLICFSLAAPAQQITQRANSSASLSTQATHLLGFANAKNNSTGTLSVQDDSLQFQQNGKPGAIVKIALVRDVFLCAESKQVGGLQLIYPHGPILAAHHFFSGRNFCRGCGFYFNFFHYCR